MGTWLGCLRDPTERTHDKAAESPSSEHKIDQPVAPSWPWLHLDYKCNTDLLSADPSALSTLGIPSRDSRLLMSSQGQETLTFFLTRGSALLAAIGALRLVIAHDQLYILSSSRGIDLETAEPPTTDNVFVRYLVSAMRALDAGPQSGQTHPALPHELRALEAVLSFAGESLHQRTAALLSCQGPLLENVPGHLSKEIIEKQLAFRRQVQLLSGQANRIKQALERLLKSENNLAGLCLTEQALQSSVPKGPDTGATAGTSSRRCTELVGSYLAQVEGQVRRLGEASSLSEAAGRAGHLQAKLNSLRLGH